YGLTMQVAGAVVGDDYAPERVLSRGALATALQILGTRSGIAIFPKRGMMFVGPGQAGELPAMLRMNQIAKDMAGRAGAAAVCSYGLFVQDGNIIGVNGEGYLSLFPTDLDPWGPTW